jgi:hypothetical protein
MQNLPIPWNLYIRIFMTHKIFINVPSKVVKKYWQRKLCTFVLQRTKTLEASWYKSHSVLRHVLIFQEGLQWKHQQQSFGWAKRPYFSLLSSSPVIGGEVVAYTLAGSNFCFGPSEQDILILKNFAALGAWEFKSRHPREVLMESLQHYVCVCFTHSDEPHS